MHILKMLLNSWAGDRNQNNSSVLVVDKTEQEKSREMESELMQLFLTVCMSLCAQA